MIPGNILAPLQNLSAAVALTDPFYAQTTLLLHFNGTNGATTFTDQKGNTVTNTGASLSTAQFRSSPTSLLLASGNRVTVPASLINFTGDFTLECFVYPTSTGIGIVYMDTWSTASGMQFFYNTNNTLAFYYKGNANISTPANTFPYGAWYHLAGTRQGTTVRFFVNGVSQGTATGVSGTLSAAQSLLALNYQQASGPADYAAGYMDEVRITNGVSRYNTNFTVPTGGFPNS